MTEYERLTKRIEEILDEMATTAYEFIACHWDGEDVVDVPMFWHALKDAYPGESAACAAALRRALRMWLKKH